MSGSVFRPGAIVRLRSGSPQLTIESAAPATDDGPRWLCVWFNAGELLRSVMPESSLVVDLGKARGEP